MKHGAMKREDHIAPTKKPARGRLFANLVGGAGIEPATSTV